jgi:phosphoglycerate-specific signal transduction histidine kinase
LIERENTPRILGDAEVLRSVFSNLFINAVQAMQKDGGKLNVTISPDGEFVKIEVATPASEYRKKFRQNLRAVFFDQRYGNGFGFGDCEKDC